jgi:hypothetical protein
MKLGGSLVDVSQELNSVNCTLENELTSFYNFCETILSDPSNYIYSEERIILLNRVKNKFGDS